MKEDEKFKKHKCFVIQKFDDGMFDKRYQETIKPALIAAGVQPTRADDILGPKPIIDKIEHAIRQTDICLAEISLDNPNVWLEVGYAYSLKKPTLLVCDREIRDSLPFDVRHQPVIFYTSQYRSGFEELEKRIIQEVSVFIKAAKSIEESALITEIVQPVDIQDITIEEQLLLYLLIDYQISNSDEMSGWQIKNKWTEYKVSEARLTHAVTALLSKDFIKEEFEKDYNDNPYKAYKLTAKGIAWLGNHPELYDNVISLSYKKLTEEIPF